MMKNIMMLLGSFGIIGLGIIIFSLILISNNMVVSYSEYLSPKKQLESGVLSNDIICRADRVLAERGDGRIACVKESTSNKLGWIILSNLNDQSKIDSIYSDLVFKESFFVEPVTNKNQTKISIIDYNIKNGNILNIIDTGKCSLLIDLNSFDDGNLQIKIPRTIVDSKFMGPAPHMIDAEFLVLLDGYALEDEVGIINPEVQTTSTYRILKFNFTNDISLIEVIGTMQWDGVC